MKPLVGLQDRKTRSQRGRSVAARSSMWSVYWTAELTVSSEDQRVGSGGLLSLCSAQSTGVTEAYCGFLFCYVLLIVFDQASAEPHLWFGLKHLTFVIQLEATGRAT